MTYPISEIDGLSAFSASKLKSLGIRTTDALLEAAKTVKGRKALAAKTGISEQQLLEWANVSDYMRVPGMGKAKVVLVRAAGVTTVRELALRNPSLIKLKHIEVMKIITPGSAETSGFTQMACRRLLLPADPELEVPDPLIALLL